jgi:hypothetical protein
MDGLDSSNKGSPMCAYCCIPLRACLATQRGKSLMVAESYDSQYWLEVNCLAEFGLGGGLEYGGRERNVIA